MLCRDYSVSCPRLLTERHLRRRKVAGYAAWAQGPYRHAFATDNLTIAVVTPTRERREQLRAWTCAELGARDAWQLADLFLVTHESPVTMPPESYFFDRLWYLPHQFAPVRLIEAPIPPDRALPEEVRPSLTGRLPEEVSRACR